jgi:hypothetical protein
VFYEGYRTIEISAFPAKAGNNREPPDGAGCGSRTQGAEAIERMIE